MATSGKILLCRPGKLGCGDGEDQVEECAGEDDARRRHLEIDGAARNQQRS
jgi:hypothetical protein